MEQKHHPAQTSPETRRSFLKKTAAAAAATGAAGLFTTPVYGQNQAPSANVKGANEKVVIGFVGLGGQGSFHLRNILAMKDEKNLAVGGVCDLWKKRREAAAALAGGVPAYEDYREMLEKQKDIDAIICATVDHWHAQVSIDSLKAGKHVYCEKPMTRYLDEAFAVADTVKETGLIYTVGAQACSDAKWLKAAELAREGMIGKLVLGQASYMRNNPKGEWNYRIDPAFTKDGIVWDHWLGPNIKRRVDFNPDHFFRWRKYYPYCAGVLGDLFPHRLHPLLMASGNPEFPVRVTAIGTKAIHTDKNTPGTPERDVPECLTLLAEFPSGYSVMVCSSTVNEYGLEDVVRGHIGNLLIGGSSVKLRIERPFSDEYDPEDYTNLRPGESVAVNEANWIECIRTGKQPNANIDLAIRTQTVISLGEMSDRLGIACHFDPETRTIHDGCGRKLEPLSYGKTELS
ncbi:MAG: gfo/Idh/MocA family oxidoreductase [Verrucomicrobia bacterium]|nr:MAG: gfo/Idh/MocA family oxidoreductase [Verrucomicrobiota bacterium]